MSAATAIQSVASPAMAGVFATGDDELQPAAPLRSLCQGRYRRIYPHVCKRMGPSGPTRQWYCSRTHRRYGRHAASRTRP